MSREITNSEAIANLNHIYGMVSPNIQRSLDVAFKAMERPQGKFTFDDFSDWLKSYGYSDEVIEEEIKDFKKFVELKGGAE